MHGISIGGHIINNLCYADDTVLISNTEENLQELVNIINTHGITKGLGLNIDKTMMISKKNSKECNIILLLFLHLLVHWMQVHNHIFPRLFSPDIFKSSLSS
jgi:hypothetical protein